MDKKILFLGTGGSVGVPLIGCSCAVCHSPDPRNNRLRPSVLLRLAERQFLIDAGPDFRLQALRYGVAALDGILFTHAHYDHTAGLDDLRPIYYRRSSPLPLLLSAATEQELRTRYDYLFQDQGQENFISRFHVNVLPQEQAGRVLFEGISVDYVTYVQGGMPVNGFRIGDLAYLSDIRLFDHTLFEQLKGVRDLIISALRHTPSPMHFSIDEAIDFSRELKVERTWLTHISHELEHSRTNAYLPENIRLAYDGLEIAFA